MSGEPPIVGPFERRLCRRNPGLGEVSEGAVEAPSDEELRREREGP
jgi:hypothetical protein